MNCDKYHDLISARLDGELTVEENAALTAHLRECPDCRAIADEMKGMHAALTDLGEVNAPPELSRSIMTNINAERTRSRRFVRQLSGLAACLLLCAGIVRVADSAVSTPNRQRSLSDPVPLSLHRDTPEHYAFCNDQYLPVTYGSTPAAPTAQIIGTAPSLATFLAQFPQDDLSQLTKAYDDHFFSSRRLLAVVIEEPSTSNRHKLDQQGLLSDSVTIIRQVPEAGDCAMAAWFILAEVDNSFSDGDLLAVTFNN